MASRRGFDARANMYQELQASVKEEPIPINRQGADDDKRVTRASRGDVAMHIQHSYELPTG